MSIFYYLFVLISRFYSPYILTIFAVKSIVLMGLGLPYFQISNWLNIRYSWFLGYCISIFLVPTLLSPMSSSITDKDRTMNVSLRQERQKRGGPHLSCQRTMFYTFCLCCCLRCWLCLLGTVNVSTMTVSIW